MKVTLIETEFWGQIQNPNLMVENSQEEVADLVAALSHHKGEVTRKPLSPALTCLDAEIM